MGDGSCCAFCPFQAQGADSCAPGFPELFCHKIPSEAPMLGFPTRLSDHPAPLCSDWNHGVQYLSCLLTAVTLPSGVKGEADEDGAILLMVPGGWPLNPLLCLFPDSEASCCVIF